MSSIKQSIDFEDKLPTYQETIEYFYNRTAANKKNETSSGEPVPSTPLNSSAYQLELNFPTVTTCSTVSVVHNSNPQKFTAIKNTCKVYSEVIISMNLELLRQRMEREKLKKNLLVILLFIFW